MFVRCVASSRIQYGLGLYDSCTGVTETEADFAAMGIWVTGFVFCTYRFAVGADDAGAGEAAQEAEARLGSGSQPRPPLHRRLSALHQVSATERGENTQRTSPSERLYLEQKLLHEWEGKFCLIKWFLLLGICPIPDCFFRPSATSCRIGLMESRTCHCRWCGGPPPWLPPLAGYPPKVVCNNAGSLMESCLSCSRGGPPWLADPAG